jgi:hypothetical protein
VFAGIPEMSSSAPSYPSNVYGFLSAGKNICREWVGLFNDITQGNVKRAGVIFDDDLNRPDAQDIYTSIQAQAATYGITTTKINCGSDTLELDIKGFAQAATTPAGLIVAMSALTAKRRDAVTLAAQTLHLPVIYPNRLYTVRGGSAECAGLVSREPICLTCTARPAATPDNSLTTKFSVCRVQRCRHLGLTETKPILIRRNSKRSSILT